MKQGKGPAILLVLSLIPITLLVSPYMALAEATDEIRDLRERLYAMTSTITVYLPSSEGGGSITFYGCTDFVKADNGTISFSGREGSATAPVGQHGFGHGQYLRYSVLPTIDGDV